MVSVFNPRPAKHRLKQQLSLRQKILCAPNSAWGVCDSFVSPGAQGPRMLRVVPREGAAVRAACLGRHEGCRVGLPCPGKAWTRGPSQRKDQSAGCALVSCHPGSKAASPAFPIHVGELSCPESSWGHVRGPPLLAARGRDGPHSHGSAGDEAGVRPGDAVLKGGPADRSLSPAAL